MHHTGTVTTARTHPTTAGLLRASGSSTAWTESSESSLTSDEELGLGAPLHSSPSTRQMRLEAGAFSQDSFWKDSERPDPSDDTCKNCNLAQGVALRKTEVLQKFFKVASLILGQTSDGRLFAQFPRHAEKCFGTSLRCESMLMVSIDLLTCRLLVGNCVGEEAHTPTVALVNHHHNTADISVPSSRSRRPSDLPLF